MNKRFFVMAILAGTLFLAASAAFGQGGAKNGPDVMRDPEMEKDSLHNLVVARQYFTLRKAYVAALQRCEEVLAGNPAFSKIDEVLYYAGKSSLNLAEGKGKQKPDQYVIHEGDKKLTLTPAEFREKARDYLSQLVNNYPQSKFKEEAAGDLSSLGGSKPKESKP
jgi:outer membrane protein assembly factor BamD (BamD/ComL family)